MPEINVISASRPKQGKQYSQSERRIIAEKTTRESGFSDMTIMELINADALAAQSESFFAETDIDYIMVKKVLEFENVVAVVVNDKNLSLTNDKNLSLTITTSRPFYITHLNDKHHRLFKTAGNDIVRIIGFVIDFSKPPWVPYTQSIFMSPSLLDRIASGEFSEDFIKRQLIETSNFRYQQILGDAYDPNTKQLAIMFSESFSALDSAKFILRQFSDLLALPQASEFAYHASIIASQGEELKTPSPAFTIISNNIHEIDQKLVVLAAPKPKPLEPKFLEKIISQTTDVTPRSYSSVYSDSVWFDLASNNLEHLTDIIEFTGNFDNLAEFVKKRETQITQNKSTAELKKSNIANYADNSESIMIFGQKFGTEKMKSILSKIPNYGFTRVHKLQTSVKFTDLLTEKENNVIRIEKDKIASLRKSYKQDENKEWMKTYQAISATINIERKHELLQQLLGWAVNKPKNLDSASSWLLSKSGSPVICPHSVVLIEMQFSRASNTEIRDRLQSSFSGGETDGMYYCRICAEKLFSEFESVPVIEIGETVESVEDSLISWIWRQMNFVVRGNVKFKELTSDKVINKFIKTLSESIYQFVNSVKKKVESVKTDSDEIQESKLKLYTILYSWAILIKVVGSNPKTLGWNSSKPVRNAFQFAEFHLSRQLSSLDSEIPDIDITDSYIKSSLQKAFKNITELTKTARFSQEKLESQNEEIKNDSVYSYFAMAERWDGNSAAIAKKIDLDKLPELKMEKYLSLANTLANPQAKLEIESNVEGYKWFSKYIRDKVFEKARNEIEIVGDHIVVTPNREKSEFSKFSEKAGRIDAIRKDLKKHMMARAYATNPGQTGELAGTGKFRTADVKNANLGRIYGDQVDKSKTTQKIVSGSKFSEKFAKAANVFHKHQWNIFLYSKYSEDSGVKISESMPDNEDYLFFDVMCDVCFRRYSDDSLFQYDVVKIMNINTTIENFYNYYRYKCPSPGKNETLHQMESGKCKNCGFKPEFYQSRDKSYFEKYIKQFNKDHSASDSHKPINTVSRYEPPKPSPIVKKIGAEPAVDKYLNQVVDKTFNAFAAESGLKLKKSEYVNVMMNLGLIEGIEFDEILSGKVAPFKNVNDEISKYAVTRVGSIINNLATMYSQIRFYDNISKPTKKLKDLMTIVGSKIANSLPELKKLTSFGEVFPKVLEEFEITYPANPKGWYLFSLRFLYEMILGVVDAVKKMSDATTKKIVGSLVSEIVESEKEVASVAKARAAEAEAQVEKFDFNDDNMVDNAVSDMFDDLIDPDFVDNFNYEGMDYDGHNDD